MVGGPCDNPGRVAERKLQRMTPTIFIRGVIMIICDLSGKECHFSAKDCKYSKPVLDKKEKENDNCKTVCGASEKP